ncbi:hypothetical protein CVT25_011212, partial [Psilocybe cyanescens]
PCLLVIDLYPTRKTECTLHSVINTRLPKETNNRTLDSPTQNNANIPITAISSCLWVIIWPSILCAEMESIAIDVWVSWKASVIALKLSLHSGTF